eukprot:TCONS_00056077-protein
MILKVSANLVSNGCFNDIDNIMMAIYFIFKVKDLLTYVSRLFTKVTTALGRSGMKPHAAEPTTWTPFLSFTSNKKGASSTQKFSPHHSLEIALCLWLEAIEMLNVNIHLIEIIISC